jgi:hypothetical protein
MAFNVFIISFPQSESETIADPYEYVVKAITVRSNNSSDIPRAITNRRNNFFQYYCYNADEGDLLQILMLVGTILHKLTWRQTRPTRKQCGKPLYNKIPAKNIH